MPIYCPKCDGQIDAFTKESWGNGVQTTRLAPYLCGWCASLLVIDLETKALMDPIQLGQELDVDIVAELKKNPILWRKICEGKDRILALHSRRPVLR